MDKQEQQILGSGDLIIQEQYVEEYLLGKTGEEVRRLMGRSADEENGNEWVYVLGSCFFGFYRKTLHLYFRDGKTDITTCRITTHSKAIKLRI